MMDRRFACSAAVVGAAVAFVLLPIWAVERFPSQDGPSHLYNAKLLLALGDPANVEIRRQFALGSLLVPNMLAAIVLSGLASVLPPLIAEKVLLTIIVAALPASMWYLGRSLGGEANGFWVAGFLFAHNNLLHLGFHGFCLGVPIALAALGYWLRHRERMTPWRAAAFFALAALAWAAHFAAFALFVLGAAVMAGFDWLRTGALRRRPGFVLRQAAFLAPPALAALLYYLRSDREPTQAFHLTTDQLFGVLGRQANLVTYTAWHEGIVVALWVLAGALALANVAVRVRRRTLLSPRDGVLLLCGVLAWLFFRLPWWSHEGGWVVERILLFAMLAMFLWFERFPAALRLAGAGLLLLLSVAQTGRFWSEYARLQPELREFAAAAAFVPSHSTLAYVSSEKCFSDGLGAPTLHLRPFEHAACWLAMGTDVVYLDNYEASYPYFPVGWRAPPDADPDFIVLWRDSPAAALPLEKARRYAIVHESRRLTLLRRK